MTPRTRFGALAVALLAMTPQAQADIYDDAWKCASAVVDSVEMGVTTGAKALKFVATKPQCVSRLGTPATAAPIGVVVGLSNAGVLPSSQPKCSAKLYDTAAQPLAAALGASLSELGLLSGSASQQLAGIASGEVSGQLLAQVPGMDYVAGSLTCGCELVDAGLSIDKIKEVIDTADKLGNACGGPVWQKAKEVAGDIVNFAGDAANEGIRQVSNLGDALAGQSKHMPYQQYFDQHWAPRVEDFATMEYTDPGNWHVKQQWRQMWEPCVSYFDGHTQSASTARYTCDNMRSGGPLFPQRSFGRLMYRRLFDFDVSIAVKAVRQQAYTEYANLPIPITLPAGLQADANALEQVEKLWAMKREELLRPVVDELYGVPTKEKTRNGLKVHAGSPPALFEPGTLGARAQDYFSEVDVNQDRADAARAVELAMADAKLQSRFVAPAWAIKRAFFENQYQFVLTMREHLRDKDQGKADSLASQCPTQACRDQIANDYAACRAEVAAWYEDNADVLGDFDSSQGRAADKEGNARREACLTQAKQTASENRLHVSDAGAGIGNALPTTPGRVPPTLDSRIETTTGGSGRRETAEPPLQGRDRLRLDRREVDRGRTEETDRRAREEEIQASTGRTRLDARVRETAAGNTGRIDASTPPAGNTGRVDASTLMDVLRRDRTQEPRVRQETERAGEAAAESDSGDGARPEAREGRSLLDARRAMREGVIVQPTPLTATALPLRELHGNEQPARDVQGNDLPGCSAVRGMMHPRVYQCETAEAYRKCLVVVQGAPDIRCVPPRS